MADHIRIRKSPGTWVISADGAVLGETGAALELTEGDFPPVIYFPRDDVAMAMMEPSTTVSTCPWRGNATHYGLVTGTGKIRDAGWSYEAPGEGVAQIAGYIAFYPDKVTVEQL